MNDVTQCIIIKYINNILLKHISKVNHYQVYESNLQVYINSISSVYVGLQAYQMYLINQLYK